MSKKILLLLVLALALMLSACGSDDEKKDDGGSSEGLTAKQVEDALVATFKGDMAPAIAITCDAEKPSEEDAAAAASASADIPEDQLPTVKCERAGDVMNCTMTMNVGGQTSELPTSLKIVDEKICGEAAPAQ